MKGKLNYQSAGALALCAAICGAALWWLAGGNADRPDNTLPTLTAPSNARSTLASNPWATAASAALDQSAASPIKDSLLTPDLRQTFESMLLEATAGHDIRDAALLKKRLAALLPQYFAPTSAKRATALLERYVDYRVDLSELKPPTDASDPRALRAALEARQQVRQRHFTGEEYDVLFDEEARLDRYTLARIEIDRNTGLSAAQKQAAFKDIERELSEAQRAQRGQATAHMNVAEQTAALNASNASDTDRYTQRRAQYGDTAATQLAQLDREDRDWQARLNDYASAQAKKASPEQLEQLSQQLFTAQEQLRVEAALAARQQTAAQVASQR